MAEIWRKLNEPAEHEVSDRGRVRRERKILPTTVSHYGHSIVEVGVYRYFVALLVIDTFDRPAIKLSSPAYFEVVTFADGNKQNCDIRNLSWQVREPERGELRRGRGPGRKFLDPAPRVRNVPISDDPAIEARRAARRRYYWNQKKK
jgi:hypothetical protein